MKQTIRARVPFILTVVTIIGYVATGVRADIRRYLPGPGAPFAGEAWGNFFTNFDREVFDTTKNINAGTIKFDYNTRQGTGTPPTYGGAALAGGFFINPGVILKPGYSLHWMQLITSQTTQGINGQNPPYPDNPAPQNPNNPIYPFESLPGGLNPAPVPLPTKSFQDFPERPWINGNNEWQAELALTCTSDTVDAEGYRRVLVVGSLLWGFALNNDGTNPNHITERREPGLWGSSASQDFFNTFNNRFRDFVGPPAPGQDRWNFVNSSNCFALPEPATCTLMLIGLGLIRRRTRLN